MLVMILSLGFINEDMITLKMWNHDLWWYAAILGLILTAIKITDYDHYNSRSKEDIIKKIKDNTKFLPRSWIGKERSHQTYNEFCAWFKPSLVIYIYELLSVITIPILLLKRYKKSVSDISDYLEKNTLIDPDYGTFLKMSYLSGEEANQVVDNKMERSIAGFNDYYNNVLPVT